MKFTNQVDLLYHLLRRGIKINRVMAYTRFGIADIRSRIAELPKEYGITPDRERVKGKRYLQYFLKEKIK
jgi:hypothetical protein